jgi:hypothetical protein
MSTVHHELCHYGIKRLKKIAHFICHNTVLEKRYDIEVTAGVSQATLVNRIAECGVFDDIATNVGNSWERLISEIVTNQIFVFGLCGLFGIQTDKMIGRLRHQQDDNNTLLAFMLIQKLVNKLSVIYRFPGDPTMAKCRKRMNDIRLNAVFKRNLFGKEPLAIAREITSFRDALNDPIVRMIFWSCYRPGTGQFKVSVSNLDSIVSEEDDCPICLEYFDTISPGIRIKPCGHTFHPRCIQGLILSLDKVVLCPMCRSQVEDFY